MPLRGAGGGDGTGAGGDNGTRDRGSGVGVHGEGGDTRDGDESLDSTMSILGVEAGNEDSMLSFSDNTSVCERS